jgi:hypothetical protein
MVSRLPVTRWGIPGLMRRRSAQSELTIVRTGRGSIARWAVYFGGQRIHGELPDAATALWARDLYYLDVPATDRRWDEVGGKRPLVDRDCVDRRDG